MKKNIGKAITIILLAAMVLVACDGFTLGETTFMNSESVTTNYKTLTFVVNDEVISSEQVLTIEKPATDPEPANGYYFSGWYTDKECTNKFTSWGTGLAEDTTLYAGWGLVANAKVLTLDYGGYKDSESYYCETIDNPGDAELAGYAFDGWYTDSTYTNKVTEWGTAITEDTTLYAKFTAYVASFVVNGEENSYSEATLTKPETDPAPEGYKVVGWYKDDAYKTEVEDSEWGTALTTNISIYARLASVWDGATKDTAWYDNNTGATEFKITTAAELAGFAQLVNNGKSFRGKTVELCIDIDLAGYEWTPIGNGKRTSTAERAFTGTFEGNGHSVYNLSVSGSTMYYSIGFFGVICNATIQNLTIASGTVVNSDAAAGIVGSVRQDNSSSKIEKCKNYASVSADDGIYCYAGGIVGYAYAYNSSNTIAIVGCENYGSISTSSRYYAGGIAGYAHAYNSGCSVTITNCENNGAVSAAPASSSYSPSIGGIVGYAYAYNSGSSIEISGCNNNELGIVSVTAAGNSSSPTAGGIVGNATVYAGSITVGNSENSCENRGTVSVTTSGSSSHAHAGGISGYARSSSVGTITIGYCNNYVSVTGITTGSSSNVYAGGIVGYSRADGSITIKTCKNEGAVTADATLTGNGGGIIGYNYGSATGTVVISDACINTGDVSAKSYAGGIVGSFSSSNDNVSISSNCTSSGTLEGDKTNDICANGTPVITT